MSARRGLGRFARRATANASFAVDTQGHDRSRAEAAQQNIATGISGA